MKLSRPPDGRIGGHPKSLFQAGFQDQKRQKALKLAEKAGVPVELWKVYGKTDHGERLIVSRTRLDQIERYGRQKGAEGERRKRPTPLADPAGGIGECRKQ